MMNAIAPPNADRMTRPGAGRAMGALAALAAVLFAHGWEEVASPRTGSEGISGHIRPMTP